MATSPPILSGIHHITAITADAQKNLDFYTHILGLRLVKLTVNFDDPSSYHLYYGDHLGRPGTILTFFAWPGAHRGRIGPPQVAVSSFAVPAASLAFWKDHLAAHAITVTAQERFGEQVLAFTDPDGLALEIIAAANSSAAPPPNAGPIPPATAIRHFHSATLSEEGYEDTARVLTDLLGFTPAGSDQNRSRYRIHGGGAAAGFADTLDLLCVPAARHAALGAGTVHHIAFRTPDDAQQLAWRELLMNAHLNVSPVMDRVYFHSIYFREPGGILFEIATDPPGFTADEPAETLGQSLQLPPWLEVHRREIESALPHIHRGT